jgi:circadian clock protein KaiC
VQERRLASEQETIESRMKTQTRPEENCSTGIAGLDRILRAGLPRNRLYLVQGNPGVGKTTLALQFLLEGAREKEKVLYIALSETKDEILAVARSHGWNLEPLKIFELAALEKHMAQAKQNTLFHPSEVELNQTSKTLLEQIERVKPTRLALDSLSELRLLSENPLRYRRQMLALKQFLAPRNCTTLLLDDHADRDETDLQVQSIAHGVITLDKRLTDFGAPRRTLLVDKLRGVNFQEGSHDYVIETGGVRVFPRLIAAEHQKDFPDEPISSGIKELDALLGGGMDRGTSTLVVGPAGTGKSSIAFQHAIAAAERGEKSLLFLFDENIKTITKRSAALGMPLAKHTESGCVRLRQLDPAGISPGEFASEIVEAVLHQNVRLLVIDSLGGYLQAMPNEKLLNLQLHELLTFLRQQGVVTIITLAQHGIIGATQSPVDVTYIADTVVLLRYFEAAGRVKKAVSVIKKRSGAHEDTIREFRIDRSGLRVGEPLMEFQSVLGGVPTFHGNKEEMLKERK